MDLLPFYSPPSQFFRRRKGYFSFFNFLQEIGVVHRCANWFFSTIDEPPDYPLCQSRWIRRIISLTAGDSLRPRRVMMP